METFFLAILASIFVSAISLFLVFIYNFKTSKIIKYAIAYCAGTLLATSFFYLIDEAINLEKNLILIWIYTIIGFIIMLVLEKFLHLHHIYSKENLDKKENQKKLPVRIISLLVGDLSHNFLDGIAIGVAFTIDINFGLATTFTIILHEIPEEMAHIAILIHTTLNKKRAVLLNFLVSLSSIVGAGVGFYLSKQIDFLKIFFLSFSAGQFVYIATVDLIPYLQTIKIKKTILIVSIFILGITTIFLSRIFYR